MVKQTRRDPYEIIVAILENVPPEGIKKTALANRCLINYQVFVKYFEVLLRNKLLIYREGKVYITEKGKRFLEKYYSLKSLFQKRPLDPLPVMGAGEGCRRHGVPYSHI